MSMSKEELQKKMAAEEERRKKEAAALIAQSTPMTPLEGIEKKPAMAAEDNKDEIGVTPIPGLYNQDWKAIVDAYKQEFKREPNEKGNLTFTSTEEATAFFTKRAANGEKFDCYCMGKDGNPTDHYLFSCGDGVLYEGTAAEVKAQLQEAVAKNPGNALTREGLAYFKPLPQHDGALVVGQAQKMRDEMQAQRAAGAKNPAAAEDETNEPDFPEEHRNQHGNN